MKIICKSFPAALIVFSLTLSSCIKSNDNLSREYNGNLSALVGKWTTNSFEGVSGRSLTFSIALYGGIATITQVNTPLPLPAVGEYILSGIEGVTPTSYIGNGRYYHITGNQIVGDSREVKITLQNNNTQMTVDFLASPYFTEVVYVYQKTN